MSLLVCNVIILWKMSYFKMQVFDFELSADEMKLIESFNIPFRACIPMIEVSQGQDLGVKNGPLLISFFSQLRLLIPLKGDVCL